MARFGTSQLTYFRDKQAAQQAGQTPQEYADSQKKQLTAAQQLRQGQQQLNVAQQQAQLANMNRAIAGEAMMPSKQEIAAGVIAPEYAGTRDKEGNLLSQYKVDPYQSRAMQELQGQAFAQGPSAWANLQTQQQKMEQQKALSDAQRTSMQGAGQARGMMARSGGLTGGASTLLARQAQRDLMNQGQNISGQGMGQRLGIQQQDLARKEGLLGQLGQIDIGAQQENIGMGARDLQNKAQFDTERYKQQMSAWGAEQTARAQAAAGGGGGKK